MLGVRERYVGPRLVSRARCQALTLLPVKIIISENISPKTCEQGEVPSTPSSSPRPTLLPVKVKVSSITRNTMSEYASKAANMNKMPSVEEENAVESAPEIFPPCVLIPVSEPIPVESDSDDSWEESDNTFSDEDADDHDDCGKRARRQSVLIYFTDKK